MQQQQTKLTLGFINAINNDINFSNNYQNTNNILNSESIINKDLIGGTTSNELNKNENNIHLNVMGYQNSNSSNNNLNLNQTINHKPQQKKFKRKRIYNKMLEESMSIESESESNQIQKTYNNLKNKINENQNIKTKKAEPIHYYYTDPLNFQWCFTETRDSSKDYYYKCSTTRCTAFGMISKTSNNLPFILTRGHSIPYYEHTYTLNKFAELNFQIPEKEFIKIFNKSKIFHNSAIRDYISHTEFVTIDSTIAYLNGKGIMDIKEEYKKEIVNLLIH